MEPREREDLADLICQHMRSQLFGDTQLSSTEEIVAGHKVTYAPNPGHSILGSKKHNVSRLIRSGMRRELLDEKDSYYADYLSDARRKIAYAAGFSSVLVPTMGLLAKASDIMLTDVAGNGVDAINVSIFAGLSVFTALAASAFAVCIKEGVRNMLNYRLWKKKDKENIKPDYSDIVRTGYRPSMYR